MKALVSFSKSKVFLFSSLVFAAITAGHPAIASADGTGTPAAVDLSVLSPTVPAGGLVQMQVFITEPKPILKGKQGVRSGTKAAITAAAASPLGPVRDAALFSSGGDVSGVAVNGAGGTEFFFSSPLETFGKSTDTPVITLAYPVRPNALAGQSAALTLDPDDSLWLNPNGQQYSVELNSGAMTVGGTLSIVDINPGAGTVLPGTVISITGVGFTPDSKVDFGEAHVATQQYVSPNLIQVTLRDAAEIRGARVRVDNPDNERATYFPYQRTTKVGNSTHALVANSFPLFPQAALTLAYFRPTLQGTMFSGIALQNLNSVGVTATLQLYSNTGQLLAARRVALGANTRFSRDLVELFPNASPANKTRLKVTCVTGIQMLGLLGDDSTGTLLPVPASATP
jgi:IPT/TIG domain